MSVTSLCKLLSWPYNICSSKLAEILYPKKVTLIRFENIPQRPFTLFEEKQKQIRQVSFDLLQIGWWKDQQAALSSLWGKGTMNCNCEKVERLAKEGDSPIDSFP